MNRMPMQPIVRDADGTLRFRENGIVTWLLHRGSVSIDEIIALPASDEEREQFFQLLGYGVSGFGDLPFVRRETVRAADARAAELLPVKAPRRRRRS